LVLSMLLTCPANGGWGEGTSPGPPQSGDPASMVTVTLPTGTGTVGAQGDTVVEVVLVVVVVVVGMMVGSVVVGSVMMVVLVGTVVVVEVVVAWHSGG
jgi:hypothetical protein